MPWFEREALVELMNMTQEQGPAPGAPSASAAERLQARMGR